MAPQGGSHTNPQWHSTDWFLSWWLEQSSPALGKSLPAVIPLPQKGTQAGEAKAAAARLFQGRNQPTTRCQVRDEQQCTPTWTWTPVLSGVGTSWGVLWLTRCHIPALLTSLLSSHSHTQPELLASLCRAQIHPPFEVPDFSQPSTKGTPGFAL